MNFQREPSPEGTLLLGFQPPGLWEADGVYKPQTAVLYYSGLNGPHGLQRSEKDRSKLTSEVHFHPRGLSEAVGSDLASGPALGRCSDSTNQNSAWTHSPKTCLRRGQLVDLGDR